MNSIIVSLCVEPAISAEDQAEYLKKHGDRVVKRIVLMVGEFFLAFFSIVFTETDAGIFSLVSCVNLNDIGEV